MRKIIQFKNW